MDSINYFSDDLIIEKKYATIIEIKEDIQQNNILRFFKSNPNSFTLQIRTHKSITEWGKGKPRRMIASCSLSIDDLKTMLKYARENQ